MIAMSGLCSRRKADEYIQQGLVRVNGEIVTEMGAKVHPEKDTVVVKGKKLEIKNFVYLLLNKPKNYICTAKDPEGRPTVMDLVAGANAPRIYPVGRLDRNTTGILLFTNDGNLAKKLMHPSSQVSKVYRVGLDKRLTEADLRKLKSGIRLEDGFIKADRVGFDDERQDPKTVLIQLHSGRNRIVRRMFEHLGYEVKRLDRAAYGPLTKKAVARGQWRYLTPMEVNYLNMAVAPAKTANLKPRKK